MRLRSLLAMLVIATSLGAACTRGSRRALQPLAVGGVSVAMPEGARLDVSRPVAPNEARVTWAGARAATTRCGERADAVVTFGSSLLPAGYWHCGRHDFFAGASSEGECGPSKVCVAARLGAQLTCISDDDACLAVAPAFVK